MILRNAFERTRASRQNSQEAALSLLPVRICGPTIRTFQDVRKFRPDPALIKSLQGYGWRLENSCRYRQDSQSAALRWSLIWLRKLATGIGYRVSDRGLSLINRFPFRALAHTGCGLPAERILLWICQRVRRAVSQFWMTMLRTVHSAER